MRRETKSKSSRRINERSAHMLKIDKYILKNRNMSYEVKYVQIKGIDNDTVN
jgi:hypothetical protein